jgi:2-keto-4-pentenoate hydratase
MSFSRNLILCSFLIAHLLAAQIDTLSIVYSAHVNNRPSPNLSAQMESFDVDEGYSVQKAFVQRLLDDGSVMGGFKAGLSSRSAQEKFGISEPVAAVLFVSGIKQPGVVIDSTPYHKLVLETELGYLIDEPILEPVVDIEHLKRLIKRVAPAIELPDAGAEVGSVRTAADIIASNAGSRAIILGEARAIGDSDVNAIEVNFYKDGEWLHKGAGKDALDNQWAALLWVVNTTITNGYKLMPGHVVITGALGQVQAGDRGHYRADYGQWGIIEFVVE